MIYEEMNKKNITRKEEIVQIKQNLKPLQQDLDETDKHQLTHAAIIQCVELILNHEPFVVTVRNIFTSCKNILNAQAGYVALIDHTGKYFEVLHLDNGGLPSTINYDSPMPIRGLRQEVLQKKAALFCNDFNKSKWMKLLPRGHARLDNVLFAPLVVEQSPVGLLAFANKKAGFDENDLLIATSFAKLSALSLSNSKAWQVMKKTGRRKVL
jgi:transcriptional regulator with GAF, ATPase, and Fis domain